MERAIFISVSFFGQRKQALNHTNVALDKSGYQMSIFHIFEGKHMLWVLIRRALARRF